MTNLRRTTSISLALLLAALFAGAGNAQAENLQFEVTVTNLMQGVVFTPFLIASHRPGVKLFTLGQPASAELESVAEEGNTVPLQNLLDADPRVAATTTTGAPLLPGQSVTAVVGAKFGFNHISLVGMLLPTKDGFVALNNVQGRFSRRSRTCTSPPATTLAPRATTRTAPTRSRSRRACASG